MAEQGKLPQRTQSMRSFQHNPAKAERCSRPTEVLYRGEQQEVESRRSLAMYLHPAAEA
jgi:hypothetical protein